MRSQELLFATGAVLLIGLASALMVFSGSEQAPSVSQAAESKSEPKPPPPPESLVSSDPLLTAEPESRQVTNTSGWTDGVIMGDILLAASAIPRLQSISVSVIELRNPVPGSKELPPLPHVYPVAIGAGTPVFTIRNIPFSDCGYLVRASSPGLNGGQQTVQVTKAHPCAEVRLAICPGVCCTVLLRDQDQGALADTQVTIVANGDPPGRPNQQGKSDSYGSVVFPDVLAGDWLVYVGHLQQPLAPPAELNVQPGTGSIRAQGITVTVPRGQPFNVLAQDILQHGIEDVQVKLLATDKTRLTQLEAQTDWSGRASFPYLAPGRYQIDVFKADYERRSGTLTVTQGEPIADQTFRMVRLR
jgi:hypothetical protein